jgi:uncharacterized repeat protein (TIGR01451 family)
MNKLLSMAAAAVTVSALAISNVYATYEFGQLGSGDIYRVRNVSDNQTGFVTTANADLCETVQFKVRVHNAGPKTLNNVKVKATLTSGVQTNHSSTVTVSADNNRADAVATGTAGVTLSKAAKLNYVSGSTELLDDNGNKMSAIGDTILTSGVNIGSVGVSLNQKRFVQFQAKVDCPTPEVKNIEVCELETKKVITVKENEFDASKHSMNLADCEETPVTPETPKTPETPAELPKTGAEGYIGLVAALLTAGVAYLVTARRNVLG